MLSWTSRAAAATGSNPIGRIESANEPPNAVTFTGWAFDRDNLASPEQIVVWRTSTPNGLAAVTHTTIARADVNRAFGITGTHGCAVTFSAPAGLHTYCVYAINVGGGTNTNMGCSTQLVVTLPSNAPVGRLEAATPSGGGVTMTGWAFDRDDTVSPEQIVIWQTSAPNHLAALTTTTIMRPDVNAVFHIPSSHGWSLTFAAPNGTHTFCAYAINVGPPGPDTLLGCRTLATSGMPVGSSASVGTAGVHVR